MYNKSNPAAHRTWVDPTFVQMIDNADNAIKKVVFDDFFKPKQMFHPCQNCTSIASNNKGPLIQNAQYILNM